MYRPRLIPVILVDGYRAIKTIQFGRPVELGDPVNMVSIFNSFRVDELVVLDIGASISGRTIDFGLLKDIASEAKMPFSVGGGIKSIEQVGAVLAAGAEKVVLSSAALTDDEFVAKAAREYGSSSITACVDVGRDWLGRRVVRTHSGRRVVSRGLLGISRRLQDQGVGEIILQSIERDGMMQGYDIPLIREMSEVLTVPVVALGGAGSLDHMRQAYIASEVSALASGSFFCFKGQARGVLISYPDISQLETFCGLR